MKYIILVGDGMGDYPLEELGGKTPLEAARTPNIDRLARKGRMGVVRTVPESMEPGSDVANMSLLGYDPRRFHTGRAPLEAASMGVALETDAVAFRCNLVALETDAEGVTRMKDYSAGHISTGEARELIAALQSAAAGNGFSLYPGVSYRHLLVWPRGQADLKTTPPHDISGKPTAPHLEAVLGEPALSSFIRTAAAVLADHPVNRSRLANGKSPANAVWLWGQGKAPSMASLKERFDLTGVMISAVDLLKGLGVYAGLEPVNVPGATGYLDTNYAGKVEAALTALKTRRFAFLHVEAPDEASHEGNISRKIEAIEAFDERVVGPVVEGLRGFGRVRLLVATDHFTPICMKTHASDPAPFLLVEDLNAPDTNAPSANRFCEKCAAAAGWRVESGEELFLEFMGRERVTLAE